MRTVGKRPAFWKDKTRPLGCKGVTPGLAERQAQGAEPTAGCPAPGGGRGDAGRGHAGTGTQFPLLPKRKVYISFQKPSPHLPRYLTAKSLSHLNTLHSDRIQHSPSSPSRSYTESRRRGEAEVCVRGPESPPDRRGPRRPPRPLHTAGGVGPGRGLFGLQLQPSPDGRPRPATPGGSRVVNWDDPGFVTS